MELTATATASVLTAVLPPFPLSSSLLGPASSVSQTERPEY